MEGLLLFAYTESRATRPLTRQRIASVPYVIEEVAAGIIPADNHHARIHRMGWVAVPWYDVLCDDHAGVFCPELVDGFIRIYPHVGDGHIVVDHDVPGLFIRW